MAQLSEGRTVSSTRDEHVDDHNELHRLHNILDEPIAPVEESGASFTLSDTHSGKLVRCTNAAQVTVTIPLDSADDLADGFEVRLFAEGAGGVTLSTSGITLAGSAPNTTVAQNEALTLKKTTAADTWIVLGGTS